jgi:hypothetical protein
MAKAEVPAKFGPSYPGHYPDEMRTQLWPLCCGARIISGFKNVHMLSEEDLLEQINGVLNTSIPDHQVFSYETMKPKLTFLTLNSAQMGSKKIMDVIAKAGFVRLGTAKPRGGPQGFFIRDESNSFVSDPINEGKVVNA